MLYNNILFKENYLEIIWKDGKKSKYQYHFLRTQCPCASCIDEWSGEQILDISKIPLNIIPLESNYVGNYALQIRWSDNHNTGIYAWKFLYKLDQKQNASN